MYVIAILLAMAIGFIWAWELASDKPPRSK
jgi:hypothetical protein